jgi:hypothetical protein
MKKDKTIQTKAESITVRVSPKLKFGLELLSRKQHRTLSSVVEWALEKAMQDKIEGLWANKKYSEEKVYILDEVWDIDEPDRLVNLAFEFPNLLTYEEEVLWKLIRENGFVWMGHYVASQWTWSTDSKSYLLMPELRENWEKFKKVAAGEAKPNTLPQWSKIDPKTTYCSTDLLRDDEIPF